VIVTYGHPHAALDTPSSQTQLQDVEFHKKNFSPATGRRWPIRVLKEDPSMREKMIAGMRTAAKRRRNRDTANGDAASLGENLQHAYN
jgi:hypothetical protein